jgi:murein biosynthesis integral membrane protein MurJ
VDLGATPVRRLVRLTLPVYLGDSGDKLNLMVTRGFASGLGAGAISGLQYAYTLVDGVQGLVAGTLVTTLFPYLSQRVARSDERGARMGLHRVAVFAALLTLPLAVGLALAADPLVVALFERGSFDESSTQITSTALRLFAPALPALALNGIFGTAFHARQDTRTPMQAGLVRVAFNGTLCAILAPWLGYRGIALAATISLYAKLVVLLAALRRLYSGAELFATARALGRVGAAVGLMALLTAPASVVARHPWVLAGPVVPALAGLACLALGAYAAGLWLFCRRELVVHVALVHRLLERPRLRRPADAAPVLAAEEAESVSR